MIKDNELKAYTYDDLLSKLRMFLANGFNNQMDFENMHGGELVEFVDELLNGESEYYIDESTIDIASITKLSETLKERHSMKSTLQDTYHQQCVADINAPDNWECVGSTHDLCPSYSDGTFTIFVDHPDPKEREDESYPRFNVCVGDEVDIVFSGDNFDDVKSFLENDNEAD